METKLDPTKYPTEVLKISVTGWFADKDKEPITLEINADVIKGFSNYEQAANITFESISKLGGLRKKIRDKEFELYPLSSFIKVTVEIDNIVGITI